MTQERRGRTLDSRGKSLVLDMRFGEVGRIKVATGCYTKSERRKRKDLLTRLYGKGRLDLLRALKAGTLSIAQLYEADRADNLDSLTGDRAALAASLWAAGEAWVGRPLWGEAAEQWDGTEPGPTQKRYGVCFVSLRRSKVLGDGATVGDLAGVDWRALLARWEGGPSDWNHLRRAVSRFLTVTLGDVYHPFRRAVVKAILKQREIERVPDLPPALFWKIVDAAPPHAQAAFVTIAALGLRVGEYLRLTREHLLPHGFAVQIPGTKTAGSAATARVDERLWPWVLQGVPSPLGYKWLRLYWKRALKAAGADKTLRLHDLRHCYGQWLADAGVGEARIQAGLRHATASMTRRYTMQRDKGESAKVLGDVMARVG